MFLIIGETASPSAAIISKPRMFTLRLLSTHCNRSVISCDVPPMSATSGFRYFSTRDSYIFKTNTVEPRCLELEGATRKYSSYLRFK